MREIYEDSDGDVYLCIYILIKRERDRVKGGAMLSVRITKMQ
jgi:hypothetical protein